CSGFALNLEEAAALQSSLILLKKNNKFSRVVFWGKLFGIHKDYLIAQGFGNSILGTKKGFCRYAVDLWSQYHTCLNFFCVSHNGVDWVQLPTIDEDTAKYCDQIRGRLTGDPSTESRIEFLLSDEAGILVWK